MIYKKHCDFNNMLLSLLIFYFSLQTIYASECSNNEKEVVTYSFVQIQHCEYWDNAYASTYNTYRTYHGNNSSPTWARGTETTDKEARGKVYLIFSSGWKGNSLILLRLLF